MCLRMHDRPNVVTEDLDKMGLKKGPKTAASSMQS